MTREEAIDVLTDMRRIRSNTITEACDMAISALLAIDIVDLTNGNTITKAEYDGEPSDLTATNDEKVQNCGDLISRHEALQAINGACEMWEDEAIVADIIHKLPSIEIVRCKDCEHRYWDKTSEFWTCYHTMDLAIEDNDFCSLAKMKGGAE